MSHVTPDAGSCTPEPANAPDGRVGPRLRKGHRVRVDSAHYRDATNSPYDAVFGWGDGVIVAVIRNDPNPYLIELDANTIPNQYPAAEVSRVRRDTPPIGPAPIHDYGINEKTRAAITQILNEEGIPVDELTIAMAFKSWSS